MNVLGKKMSVVKGHYSFRSYAYLSYTLVSVAVKMAFKGNLHLKAKICSQRILDSENRR